MAELGSDNFDQELTLSLLGSEENALEQIEGHERIEDGSYGQCETCGMKIPKSRLEAIPYAARVCPMCFATGRRPRALTFRRFLVSSLDRTEGCRLKYALHRLRMSGAFLCGQQKSPRQVGTRT